MQLILRPVSDARLKEIIVTDSSFAIGRNEGHFESYEPSIIAKLSRHHARIFERDGCAYVADLHSSNGTTVNGQAVADKPVRLRLDDEIQFGDLRYRVEYVGAAETKSASKEQPANAKIILTPTAADGSLDPIVVSTFPFLVSRYNDAFARHKGPAPGTFSLLSRHHAKLSLRQNAIYVEDLDSTNGTYVCGEKVTRARKLVNDDIISFGDDFFSYKVQVFVGDQTVIEAKQQIEKLAAGTVFVNDATNFFEVYMAARNRDDSAKSAAEASEADASADVRRAGKKPFGNARRFLRELRESLESGEPMDRALRWTVLVSLAALIGAASGYWYLAWPARRIDSLIEAERYQPALQLANRYLERRPQNEQLRNLAAQAMLKSFVPDWRAAINAGDFAAAREALTTARKASSSNPEADRLIATLALATDISAFKLSTDRRSMLLNALSGDNSVGALVEKWDSRQSENRRALLEVARAVDGFDVYETDFYRSLRELRERADELEPFRELRKDITAALASRNAAVLRQELAKFSAAHPDANLDLLAEDVARYEAVEQDIGDGQWLRAYDRAMQTKFNTAPFIDQLALLTATVLPDELTRRAYQRAAELWAKGEAAESFGILEKLAGQRWGEDAQRMLTRNRQIQSEVAELLRNTASANFEDHLFAVFRELDPVRDAYLHTALRPEFQRHREEALRRAEQRTRKAQEAWNEYQRLGGLQGVHRLQEQVTPEYRRLAGLLSAAYQNLRESELIRRQLDTLPPQAWADLNGKVLQEIKLQTGIVSNLLVIDPSVRKQKLGLLPELPRD